MIVFFREDRYLVIKRSDINSGLTALERELLYKISLKVADHRARKGKTPLDCVVVEADWPEYEPTWAAIAERCCVPTSST